MDDLISRQAAIEAILAIKDYGNSDRANALGLAECAITTLPSAQPEKRTETHACDCISRQKAIDAIHEDADWLAAQGSDWQSERMERDKSILKSLPSSRPDIIACGDCIHWICHDRRCGYWNHGVKPLDWCCHAERRTDG